MKMKHVTRTSRCGLLGGSSEVFVLSLLSLYSSISISFGSATEGSVQDLEIIEGLFIECICIPGRGFLSRDAKPPNGPPARFFDGALSSPRLDTDFFFFFFSPLPSNSSTSCFALLLC
jgi:hypothetical protein